MRKKVHELETRAIHNSMGADPSTGAVSQPLYLSTTFERDADGEYSRGFAYVRENNPNRATLESAIADLEGGDEAAAFASGSVASMSLFQALSPGDHLLAPLDVYFGIRQILLNIFVPWGLEVDFVDMGNLEEVRAAIKSNTRLLFIETPSNPLLRMTDLAAIATLAHEHGALVACDNTMATPVVQRPIEHGIDLVIHATTKYISGHSDSMAGIVIAREASPLFEQLRFIQKVGGAVAAPFDCWLCLRGLQTLAVRMKTHCANAMEIAGFLEGHPAIQKVHFPGLDNDPGHELAAEQMSAFGAMISFLVDGDEAAALAVAGRAKIFTRATSFGGTHSFIEHRASVESEDSTTPRNLLRISVGLESAKDLIADLEQALGALQ